nr:MAG TPA: hypothetical protein [Caudoviricetes sp.]
MIEQSVSLASNGVVKVPGYEQLVRFGYTKNRGVYRLHVDATGEWEGLTIRAFWHVPDGKDPASSLVVDGSVDVPASVTAQPGNGCITFEGSDGTKTVTSADLRYRVSANSGTEDGTEPEPGTPAWQQLVDAVHTDATAAEQAKTDSQTAAQQAADSLKELKNGIASGEFKGEPGTSPTVAVQDIAGGHRIVITDATGTSSVDVLNGKDGAPGKDATVDATLSQSGKAADAKVTGDALARKAVIDDTTVTDSAPWSSKHIVDMLCPPLDETGNPVVCYPVADYPLGVTASWEPTQEGSGEPSPENIRPIKGRDSATVERCGENVIEFLSTNDFNSDIKIAVDAEKNITLNGTTVVKSNIIIGMCRLHWVAGKTYTMYVKKVGGSASLGSGDGITFAYSLFTTDYNHFFRGDTNSTNIDAYIASNAALVETELVFMLQCWRPGTVFNNFKFQIEVVEGTTPPTTYAPYIGQTATLTLPRTIYGGTVDAVTGEGQEKLGLVTFDGSEAWTIGGLAAGKRDWYYVSPKIVDAINDSPKKGNEICSHYPHYDVTNNNTGNGCALVWSAFRVRWGGIIPENTDAWKSYLAAQYAAGTPVQVAYKLAEPVLFTATGAQPISALSGVNTVLTDADSATVTGRADPIKRITDLEDAMASMT